MKNKVKKQSVLSFLLILFMCHLTQAQKSDIILTVDDDIIEAKVTLVGDTRIQYQKSDDEKIYELATAKIRRIKYANGETLKFGVSENKTKKEAQVYTYPPFNENLVAVIPFDFYDGKSGKSLGRKGLQAQEYVVNRLISASDLEVLDNRKTISYLRKAKVDYRSLETYDMDELGKILGAGTIVCGSVQYSFDEKIVANDRYVQTSEGGVVVKETVEINEYGDAYYSEEIYEVPPSGYWDVDISQYEKIQTVTRLEIYKQGKKIFTEMRDPLFTWNLPDQWEGNIDWLLKKSPWKVRRPK